MSVYPKIIHSQWFIIIAFLVLVGPMALNFNFYYPDEVHYTDAAIQMLQNDDYLTPYQGSGEVRFNKPILTYWVVILGYQLFGISAFASRFFFLISGALILFLVYKIGKLIYTKHEIALIGTAIVATNATLVMSTIRSIPDILLCLFITMSALGFAGFIKFGNQTPKKYNWIMFIGLALAFEVKGIPAVLFGIVGLAFLILNPWRPVHWKKILHWPSVLISLIIALSWFGILMMRFGQEFTQSFYNDQLGERITINIWSILSNIGLAIGLMVALFFPWITFMPKKIFQPKFELKTENIFAGFVITWIITSIILSGMVFKFYERYLLPVIPVYSIIIGYLIITTFSQKVLLIKVWSIFIFVLQLMILLFAVILDLSFKANYLEFSLFFVAILLTIAAFVKVLKSKNHIWLAFLLLLLPLNLSFITHNISFPNEGQQIAQILENNKLDSKNEIGYIGNMQIASKLRIASKSKYKVKNLSDLYAEYESENYNTIIVSEEQIDLITENNFNLLGSSYSWKSTESYTLFLSILKGNFAQELKETGKRYHVLQRKPGT